MLINIKVTGGLNIEWGQIDPTVTGGLNYKLRVKRLHLVTGRRSFMNTDILFAIWSKSNLATNLSDEKKRQEPRL